MSGRAVIAGAGVGGLAAAVALDRAGWEVQVLERGDEVRPIGAGLSIWPNAVLALRSLGLGEIADAPGVIRGGGALRRADGTELAAFDPEAIAERYGAPLVGVHRADIHEALLSALPAGAVRTSAGVAGAEQGGVRLVGGGTVEGDLVVGADGLHSVVRESVLGPGDPRESGIAAYRGVVSGTGEVPAGEWWGEGIVAGLLPIAGDRTYWYLAFRGAADGSVETLAEKASGFGDAVREVIRATEPGDVLCHALFDRDPPEAMAGGRIALVGDAAHPMLPFLGQGACCAIEDAAALGEMLDAHDGVEAALAAYDAGRVPRAAKLVEGSRRAAKVALAESGAARAIRNALLRAVPSSVRLRQLDPVIGR